MTNVKMPKKLRGFFCTKCGSYECKAGFEEEQHPPCDKCDYLGFGADLDYTEAQLKQYGDDRAQALHQLVETFVKAIALDRNDWEDWPKDSREAFAALAKEIE